MLNLGFILYFMYVFYSAASLIQDYIIFLLKKVQINVIMCLYTTVLAFSMKLLI